MVQIKVTFRILSKRLLVIMRLIYLSIIINIIISTLLLYISFVILTNQWT